jgi:tetratricopeptide (TPR) repeat protein
MTKTGGKVTGREQRISRPAASGEADRQQKAGWKLSGRESWLSIILIVVVCGVVAATYWPVLSAETLSTDDHQYFTGNALVQNPGWASARRFLTEILEPSTVMGYYQPLTMISLMLDYALGGREDNLLPFHCTSLILHVSNTALIIVLLYLLFGRIEAAAMVGLLFGVHPLTVEPVPWVSERKTLLAAFFSLWSLIFYVYSRTMHNARRTAAPLYISSLIAYLLALMSKPTSVPLPAVMLLMDYWPLNRLKTQDSRLQTQDTRFKTQAAKLIFEKLPFFVLGGIFAVITYISQKRTAGALSPGEMGAGRVLFILCHNIIFYLYKVVWPVRLSSFYGFPKPLSLSHPMVLAGVVGTCILIPVLIISLRWTRAVLTGFSVFFVAIFPTMGVIGFTIVIACDKYVYLPSVGLLMILAAFLCRFLDFSRARSRYLMGVSLAAILVVILAATEVVGTRRYLGHWADSLGLFQYMLKLSPDSEDSVLYHNLGYAYNRLGRYDEAVEACKKAMIFDPNNPYAHNSLGLVYINLGRYKEATEQCRQAIKIRPDYTNAYVNLGYACGKLGRYKEAIKTCEEIISLKPDLAPMAHNNLGCIYGELRQWLKAIEEYKRAIKIKPDYADAYRNLGNAYRETGRYKEAIDAYKKAIKDKPDYSESHYDLGIAYGKVGSWAEAAAEYKEALRTKPDYAEAYCNLGVAYSKLHQYPEAIRACEQAVKIEPNYAKAHYDLGVIYLTVDSNSAMQQYKILKGLDSELAERLSRLISR